MHWLTLRFADRNLEKAFLRDYFDRTWRRAQITMVAGILVYIIHGLADRLAYPDQSMRVWLIRYVVVGVCVPLFLLSFVPSLKKWMKLFFYVIMILGGFGVVAMTVVTRPPASHFSYPAGLFLMTMFYYVFIPVRFIHATAISWTIFLAYGVILAFSSLPLYVPVTNIAILSMANFIGMVSSYHSEQLMRTGFLNRQDIERFEKEKYRAEKDILIQDLHDGIGGMATNIMLLAEIASTYESTDEMKSVLATISRLSRDELSDIRTFMKSLDTLDNDWHSITADLRNLGSTMLEPHGIDFRLEASLSEDIENPPSFFVLNLFRIYKEAITNIIKHSGALHVKAKVLLSTSPPVFSLSISDDGTGLGQGDTMGRGMGNIRDRAEKLGGKLEFRSEGGTELVLTVPVPLKYPIKGIDSENDRR